MGVGKLTRWDRGLLRDRGSPNALEVVPKLSYPSAALGFALSVVSEAESTEEAMRKVLLLVLIPMFLLAACGKSEETPAPEASASAAAPEASASAEASAAAPAESAAASPAASSSP